MSVIKLKDKKMQARIDSSLAKKIKQIEATRRAILDQDLEEGREKIMEQLRMMEQETRDWHWKRLTLRRRAEIIEDDVRERSGRFGLALVKVAYWFYVLFCNLFPIQWYRAWKQIRAEKAEMTARVRRNVARQLAQGDTEYFKCPNHKRLVISTSVTDDKALCPCKDGFHFKAGLKPATAEEMVKCVVNVDAIAKRSKL
jgi:hypothetical protein